MEAQFKHIFWNLSTHEIDLLNVLINIVERNDAYDSAETFDYSSPQYVIDTNMHELSSSLGFLTLNIDHIIRTLEALNRNTATVYYEQDYDIFMDKTSFVQKFTITSTKKDINKRLRMLVSTSLIKILREDKKLFEKFYRYEKYGLRSKYSRVIYDHFMKKDRTKSTTVYELEEFIDIIDFELDELQIDSWSRLSTNVLKRAAKELHEKSNMYFEYTNVKDKISDTNRTQTTKIKFSTTFAPEMELPGEYFTNDFLMKRKIAYYIERDVNNRVETQLRFKTKTIDDIESYRYSVRRDLEKNSEEYESKVLLQEWINVVKYDSAAVDGLVVLRDFTDDHHYITINNNFKLYDIEKRTEISTTAKETRLKVNNFLINHGGTDIIETTEFLKNCSISHVRG